MDKAENGSTSAMPILADLVAMYVITGLLLVILAAVLGRVEMPDSAVSIGIIATYIVSCFAGGFLIGKKKKKNHEVFKKNAEKTDCFIFVDYSCVDCINWKTDVY